MRQNKGFTRGFICWSFESPNCDIYVSVEEAWITHQEPTPSRVSFNRFLHSTKLLLLSLQMWNRYSQTFSWFTTTLGALGWCLSVYDASPPIVTNVTKVKCSQRGSHSTQTWISHKSQKHHKEVLERAHKGLEISMVHGWHQHPPKEGGEAFILAPPLPQTSRWELASKKTGTFSFGTETSEIWKLVVAAKIGPSDSGNRLIQFSQVQWDVKCMRLLYFTHLTWIFRLCWALRLFGQAIWYPS
jgi:hypothetical protein